MASRQRLTTPSQKGLAHVTCVPCLLNISQKSNNNSRELRIFFSANIILLVPTAEREKKDKGKGVCDRK